jgi:predicted extracellular nuclease
MSLPRIPGLHRWVAAGLLIAVVLAALPALSVLGSPPAVPVLHPATPVASPVASGLRIRDLQGAGHRTTREGQFVADVPGIVTAIVPEGFYLQDPVPDTDEATSEGILVVSTFAPRAMPQIAVGDALLVDGIVEERYGGDPQLQLSSTQLVPFEIAILSQDQPLPDPVGIDAVGRHPPADRVHDATGPVETTGVFQPALDAIDFYESLEGMLVALPEAVVVGPRNDFGEVVVLSDAGMGAAPRTARGGIAIQPEAADFNPERFLLDDEVLRSLGATLPNVDVGAHFAEPLVGVLDYDFGAYRVQVIAPQAITSPGAPREVAPLPNPDELVIATLNVENLAAVDPTLWEVEETAKFAGLAQIIVGHLHAPDLIVLEEIQDNNGEGRDPARVVDASATAQRLIDTITAQGGPPYAFVDVDPEWDEDGGAPGGNIRVAFLYRTDREITFTPRGTPTATTASSVGGGTGSPQLSTNPGRILAPASGALRDAFDDSRKPLVAEFTVGEQPLFVIGNHFTARSGSGAFFGQVQPPPVRGGEKRQQQATIVGEFVGDILGRDPAALVVVLGDFNDFYDSQTLATLAAADGQGPLTNLVASELPVEERYSYVFEGNSQALDHLLLSPALHGALVPGGFDIVHVNAEYVDQVSDHDPLLARFLLVTP